MQKSGKLIYLKESPGVRFLPIDDWPGYIIGEDGWVWCCKNKAGILCQKYRRLACPEGSRGYRRVTLTQGSRRRDVKVCVLVIEAFVGLRPKGKMVRHRNDIRSDDKLSNLRYGTNKQNAADAKRNGRLAVGIKHGMVKYTEDQVRSVRKVYQSTNSPVKTAAITGVRLHTVRKIVYPHHSKSQWKDLV